MAPRPTRRLHLAEPSAGDESLIAQIQNAVRARRHDRLSVATFAEGQWQTAHFGASDALDYEIGSVTKTFTASLLALAIARGEVAAQTPVGELLELGSSPAAALALGDIATQTSGLPRLPVSFAELRRGARAARTGLDPYIATVPELVAQAAATPLGRAGTFNYSNLGFAVLGQALAAAAGTSYSALVEERIAVPLGLSATRSAATVAELPADAATGFDARGRVVAPWAMNAYGPAGNIRSTLPDMMRYTQAQLDGSAPGQDATTPRVSVPKMGRIGYAWLTSPVGVTWHNGMTGGFASFVGFDRQRSRAVVVLSNTAVSVDALALSLIADR
ncbi:CubicO group peptidase (beta-lactamase class C family) [Salinibacterium amurskyense]|uniref:CubicO group peptidase (Beta-lactamase class C family) n=1 Tax=Salinibacterium amurskyense TaxID=205941 RepID=A0A2M9D8E1_9MICO|nr:serine hydrolase domain-containing protein [Salinibacterium amurskyense]PJJ81995.1 CubicO group peptidase (beta-lactamase class C family) [Salinibacterium amurskyense]RLQ81782.1 class A beta-lactamase-related serine hydrolase [Salinibacterium amurskyense]GHD78535.1 serine hydrolase [Salinibacterium amurskyense]